MDLRVDYLQFGGTAFFPQDSDHFMPYLSLTIGATLMEPDSGAYDSETRFSGSIGGGFRIPFNDNVSLNLGVRGYLTLLDSDIEPVLRQRFRGGRLPPAIVGQHVLPGRRPAGAQRPVLTVTQPAGVDSGGPLTPPGS